MNAKISMLGTSHPTISADVLEEAAHEVEKLLVIQSQYVKLSGKLRVTSSNMWKLYKNVFTK